MKKEKHISAFFSVLLIMVLVIYGCTGITQTSTSIFSMENITPWCIVPFDSKERNPSERAEMLSDLGFKTMAYDWRAKNIPEFDEEVRELEKRGIKMTAFWWSGGLPESGNALETSEIMQMQVDFFRRNSLNLDVWITLSDNNLRDETDEVKYTQLAKNIDILASELKKTGCRLGLYNHGGWGGQPINIIETLKRTKSGNIGIVYNFHHAHEHLDIMPDAFHSMVPYLYCVNLNGMNIDGPKILTLGEGTEDLKIIRMIADSKYKGPIGIIGHIENEDVEIVLKRNLEGLKKLIIEIGDKKALKSYQF